MPDILVIGSLNADLVVRVPRFPQPGETISGDDLQTFPGGKGANQAVAAAGWAHLFPYWGASARITSAILSSIIFNRTT